VTTVTQDSHRKTPVPRLAFLGFCDRAETITEGHVVFWKINVLGVSHSRVFYVFPVNLRGMTLALGIFQPRAGKSFQLAFRGTQGQTPFEIVFRIENAVQTNAQSNSTVTETIVTTGIVDPAWPCMPKHVAPCYPEPLNRTGPDQEKSA
jgi:hypothetical protein